MGMAASQGRLLMLTARLHDVELRAQQLQNAKLQLSTQQDAAYEEYQKALDATTLTMATIDGAGVTSNNVGTFNSIFAMGAARPANMSNGVQNQGYILLDSRGRVVVEDEIVEGYEEYTRLHSGGTIAYQDNAYQFAYFMLEGGRNGHQAYTDNGNHPSNLMNAIQAVYQELTDMDTLEEKALEALNNMGINTSGFTDANMAMQILNYAQCNSYTLDADPNDIEQLNNFVNYFWSHHGNQVFNKLEEIDPNAANAHNGHEYSSSEFNYYVRIYNAIQQHGGCVSINDFDGPDGSAANNADWLTNMLQSGQLSIEMASVDGHGEFSLDGVSVSSDVNLNYSQTSQIDKVALAKAEAKYEHEMKIINKKDEKFDLQLKKIETERTAITKEYDSIKKVSDDNIERTFGIFS